MWKGAGRTGQTLARGTERKKFKARLHVGMGGMAEGIQDLK